MSPSFTNTPAATCEHFDVLIVGAGISGVGAAHHLGEKCPGKSYVMLETKESFGGTWRQHTYPGIRSDSDLYTFGYGFKPWTGQPIASGGAILDYMEEAIEEDSLEQHIRYQHEVLSASWSGRTSTGLSRPGKKIPARRFCSAANFLWMCQGYYQHAEGYTPQWEGMDDFKGQLFTHRPGRKTWTTKASAWW